MKTAYVITKVYQTGKRDFLKGFFSEEKARYEASQIMGKQGDLYTVSLTTIEIETGEAEEQSGQLKINWEKTSEEREKE